MSRRFIQPHSAEALPTNTIKNPKAPPQKNRKNCKSTRQESKELLRSYSQSASILPENGYVRLPTVLAVIPICKSSWWNGIREGRYPKPTKKFGPKIAAWDVRDIRALIESSEA